MDNDYVYDILSQGTCPALVPGTWFMDGGRRLLVWDMAGLLNVHMLASGEIRSNGLGQGMHMLLKLVSQVFHAVRTAEDWLVPAGFLQMSNGGVWFDPASEQVRFMMKNECSAGLEIQCSFCSGMQERAAVEQAAELAGELCVLSGIPAAAAAAQRINDAAASGATLKDLIKLACSLRLLTMMI